MGIDVAFDDVVGFIRDQFDVRGVNRTGYTPSGFRSDGCQVQVLYMALKQYIPLVRGTDNIHLAGYQVPENSINIHTAENGLSLLSATKLYSQQTLNPRRSGVDITAVDPGCSSLVSVRRCPLWACEDHCSIIDNSETWEERGVEYSKKSGRTMLEVRERKRRRKRGGDSKDGKALNEYCEVSIKTFVRASLIDHCKVAAKNFKVMSAEKGKWDRKRSRFHFSRLVQKTVDRLANKIAGTKSDNAGGRNIVLFGKASFKPMKGHARAPRKKVVKASSSRVVVLLVDEFRTSTRCSGGCGGDMEDVQGLRRVRQCSTGLDAGVVSPCPLSLPDGVAFQCDRDASATINFCSIGCNGLVRAKWPSHLMRESQAPPE